jgi:hypothetical protein
MRLVSKASYVIGLIGAIALTSYAADARPRQNNHYNEGRSSSVYDTRGHYVGSDPDPTVRSQLAHDPTQGD